MKPTKKINAEKNAVTLAEEILSGRIDLLLGVRKILPNLFILNLDMHPDFITFKSVESQEDHLMIEFQNSNLSHDAQMRAKAEIKIAEGFHREYVFTACKKLIEFLNRAD